MSNFKYQLEKDLSNVFFNNNEFAEKIIVNGKEVTGIIDENYFKDAKFSTKKEINIVGESVIYTSNIALLVKTFELGYKPGVGNRMQVNDSDYEVKNVKEENGIYIIELGSHEEI